MRELATLLVVVLLVYLFQCLCWAGPGAQVFSLEPSRRNGRKKRGFLWVALKLRGYWANPLPPLQPLMVVDWPTFQPDPEMMRLAQPDAEPVILPWEQLTVTRSATKLLCNGVVVLQAGADQIKSQQAFLQRLKQAKGKERKKLIEAWLRNATDTAAAEDRLKLFCHKARWLDIAVNLQFFLLFMIVPMAFFRFGSRALWPMLAAVIATSIFIAWQSWRLHKGFFPGDGDGRFKSVFGTVLSPIYAIRAADALARDLLAGFHPVAVAGVVCSQREFEAFAGEQLRANKFGQAGTSWYRDQLQLALTNMLGKKGVEAKRLLAAPERDSNCVMYCPRCRAQYTKTREACADCGYGQLLQFAGQMATEKPAVQ
jgi:ribosomal protein L37E